MESTMSACRPKGPRPLPESMKNVKMNIGITLEQRRAICDAADRNGLRLSEIIRESIDLWLAANREGR